MNSKLKMIEIINRNKSKVSRRKKVFSIKSKFVKVKQLKIALQMYKTAINKLNSCKSDWNVYGMDSNLQMNKNDFYRLCKLLRIEPIINSNWSSDYKYHAHIYYQGITLCCIYKDNTNLYNKWELKDLEKRFKELFFEIEDKEKAFQKLRNEVLEKYKGKYESKQPIYWMNSYQDFEKYLNRHKIKRESYESKYNKYIDYRKNFNPLEEDISYKETERERPYRDYFVPMTFKEWNKAYY